MQGGFHPHHHHHQQPQQQQHQLAALLAAALPKADTGAAAPASSSSGGGAVKAGGGSDDDEKGESARLAAIGSLHRAILYPPNSFLVAHSASFLTQGLSQLLADKLYSVRQSAATAYGALCAVICSVPVGSNGRPNPIVLGSLVDRFIGWALPLLSNVNAGEGTAELAVEGLREFLSAGDAVGVERFVLPILKACQLLLEDERTSFSLLHLLLGVLTLISMKFSRFFQPHFLDVVDLLLGWVLVPDLPELDRRVVLDSFLQFQKHWVSNLQFSIGLLSKFLGDMEVLLQDGSHGTPTQLRRLLALLSCFCTVLQSTASGLLEINLLEQITESLIQMLPQLLRCLSMVGNKFGWVKWMEDCWKCLTLLAEILREKFSAFYPLAADILFQSLLVGRTNNLGAEKISSIEAHGILKTNLQLLSLQKLGLLPSTIQKILQFDGPVSQMRLHPNHLVTGSSAATYIFLLQHSNDEIVQQAISYLIGELQFLKGAVTKALDQEDGINCMKESIPYLNVELFALMKFDLKVLLTCISFGGTSSLVSQPDIAAIYLKRSEQLTAFLVEMFNPFDTPISKSVDMQVNVIRTLERLTEVELLSMHSMKSLLNVKNPSDIAAGEGHEANSSNPALLVVHIKKYSSYLARALHVSAPLAVKLVALEWIQRFAKMLITNYHSESRFRFESSGLICLSGILSSVLDAALDKEARVRSQVPLAIQLLLQARLLTPLCFALTAEVVLEKLSDPDVEIKNSFVRLFSYVLPMTMHACGFFDLGTSGIRRPSAIASGHTSDLHWKQVFALRQLRKQLYSQQLVSVLSYISQRWKVPLSSWIKRLIHSCKVSKEQLEEGGGTGTCELLWNITVDEYFLEKVASVNNLAGAWWAIHEAARYCIATRLRTNLGGPTQTFAALERMLLDVSHVLELDIEHNDGNLSIIGSSGARLLPMRLLLDFVEALKKNVYNAYEGSAILHPAARQSSLFFRANRKVCEEWFSRICEPMMNAGLGLQCHDAAVQYCSFRLQELKLLWTSSLRDKSRGQASDNYHRLSGDILRVLRHMGLALCRNHEPEALFGLQQWASMVFSPLLEDEHQSSSQSGKLGNFAWISGLAYQAKGQYEIAAAHFIDLLQNEESAALMGSDGVQFVIGRIIECYTSLSDWRSLESWLLELQTLRSKHAGKSYSGALTTAGNEINAIHALARFDEGDFQAAWTFLDLTPKSSSELTLDPRLAMQRSEQMLLQAMLHHLEGKADKVLSEIHKAKSMLEEMLSVLPLDSLAEAAPCATQLHCIFALEEGCQLKGDQENLSQHESILSSCGQLFHSHLNESNQDCSPWLKVFRVYRTSFPNSPVSSKLCMSLSRLARKQGNAMLASRLNNHLRDLLTNCSNETCKGFLLTCLQYEEILLMHSENKFEDALANLWSFLRPIILSSGSALNSSNDDIVGAKACLKLSLWLKRYSQDVKLKNFALKIQADLDVGSSSFPVKSGPANNVEILSSKPMLSTFVEELVGTATKLSTKLCPTMGKSWISYATWCFSQASNAFPTPNPDAVVTCSFSPILDIEFPPERFSLTADERVKVQSVVLQLFCKPSYNSCGQVDEWKSQMDSALPNHALETLVQQVSGMIESAAGAPGAESSNGERLSFTIASRLRAFFKSTAELEETDLSSAVDVLVNVWWSLRKRRVLLFGHAAYGFAQSLRYASSKLSDGVLVNPESEALKQSAGSYSLRATLYLLHILLNYGAELNNTIESALSTVPLSPWQEITPQLFARVSSHPEQVVRKQLETLLIMLAKLSPCSIVFPTLVDVNTSEQLSEELEVILHCLRQLYPRLIQGVQLMINELENVTVLWEELWLSTIQDLHADVVRRINVLKEEAARTAENVTLGQSEKIKINAAKYSAMMAPIVVALERRLASTSRKPETPHELWFYEEYRERLRLAILAFKTPPTSAASLGDVWRPFEDIATSLASYQRKSSVSLEEVAPRLALLSSSNIPMPGLEKEVLPSEVDWSPNTALEGIVTIASFRQEVTILSTKTKPKKLVILGSDGNEYTYLLKGREDLRLDARIMQLLQAVNGLLRSESETNRNLLSVRYYTVTPISGRAGLIQWVDNVISIYSVFKCWQNRMQLAQLSAIGGGNAKGSVPPPVPRPSDMFYGKIIPALKEKGIRKVISRRDWPQDVKRKVLMDLMKEVPKQLLHQELWCASEGFKAFSSKLRRYSGSVAAMSMVGHVLGLGDRHLDNILVDFCTGEIVHIDYNICFDKGQRLKIPEIVPFRLTQVIEGALGLTGVDGTFRANCEAVIDVLRKNKDVLLMLLEVFVWDPLVEWTRGDFHDDAAIGGEERKGMELAVSLSLFASRVQEIRVPLQEHRDLFLAALPAVEYALQRFADLLNQYELASALFVRADQERSSLIFQETSAKSQVAEATNNSEKSRASFEFQAREYSQAKAIVADKAQEAATRMEQHGRILDALKRNLLPEVNLSMNLSSAVDSLSLTSAVLVAGVPLTIVPEPTLVQCQDIDRETLKILTDLDLGVSSALSGIQAYSLALQRILPLNYLATSALHGWAQVLQQSATASSSDTLSLSRMQAAELFANLRKDNTDSIQQTHNDLCHKVETYALEMHKVEQGCAELVNSIGLETEMKAKDRLLSTFLRYMQSFGLVKRLDANSSSLYGLVKHEAHRARRFPGEPDERKEKVLSVLKAAAGSMYEEIKHRVVSMAFNAGGEGHSNDTFSTIFSELEEQVEKSMLVSAFFDESEQLIGKDTLSLDAGTVYPSHDMLPSVLKTVLISCKSLIGQMIEIILVDLMRPAVSMKSEVMDVFGLISQVRGSIDMALERLLEVELERMSLVELENSYFVKVGLITEKQLALEEASVKGRDHLSWEEAEELASQEEACKTQLDELHKAWNLREVRTSSLTKTETDVKDCMVSSELHFQSLVSTEELKEPHPLGSKALLSLLNKPFSELESVQTELFRLGGSVAIHSHQVPNLVDLMNSGYSLSENIWKFGGLLNNHSFFIWKVCVVDSFLDLCIHDVASSLDQNLSFDQLLNVVKKKLENQLQEHIGRYLKDWLVPTFLAWLDKETEHLNQLPEMTNDYTLEQGTKDTVAVSKIQLMLEEYCNAHETARAARSAASAMKRQVKELKEALQKSSLEIVQLEWMYDGLTPSHRNRMAFQKFLSSDDILYSIIPNLSRPQLLDGIKSAATKMASSIDFIQACERNSIPAEGQLERAMIWACGAQSSNASGNNASKGLGVPPEFHEHLMRRRQLLWEAREKASDVVKTCLLLLEFEASRDGIYHMPGELYSLSGSDGRSWQQTYMKALTKLEVAYHSFARAEQEWKLAESTLEAASSSLYSASNELSTASTKAKSASGDLQNTVLAMGDCAYEVSVALSTFGRLSKDHTALTSESGTMLEEVLAITEDLHDVHKLGREAAVMHRSLMEELSKANGVLLPLEAVISKDAAAMADAITRERETRTEVSPIHGQAIYQSYHLRVREAIQTFKPLIPSLKLTVEALYSILVKLARTASLHAGNLHKALEGLAESQEEKSLELRLDIDDDASQFDNRGKESLPETDDSRREDLLTDDRPSLEDKGWLSPPDSVYSSRSESGLSSSEVSVTDSRIDLAEVETFMSKKLGMGELNSGLPTVIDDLENSFSDHPGLEHESLNTTFEGINGLKEPLISASSPTPKPVCSSDEFAHPPSENTQEHKAKNEVSLSTELKIDNGDGLAPSPPNMQTANRVTRGKNAYAMSVLRRIEMKIDGQDISDKREIKIQDQVDYLLKQATSVDNLCNMYEGWTPWI